MSDNERLFLIYEFLKSKGLIKTYVELSQVLGTNKAGINDLKTGKKKVSVENIRSMILAYPLLSVNYIILGEGQIESTNNTTEKITISDYTIDLQKRHIEKLEQEIELLKKEKRVQEHYPHVAEPKPELKKNR